ncbi:T-complex protein 1 subunit theta [Dirofilaria immitis]|nr:T-complex protein 1 subunit theta [Dirofilaria immitis]
MKKRFILLPTSFRAIFGTPTCLTRLILWYHSSSLNRLSPIKICQQVPEQMLDNPTTSRAASWGLSDIEVGYKGALRSISYGNIEKMAMIIPKSGYARFLKDGVQHFKGTEEAVQRNIEACIELSSQIQSAFGPSGMNKMMINHIEKLFVTNDAGTILKELEVQHPAAKMLVMATQMQEKQIGDGTNTVVIFGAALLEHASQLLNMGLSPSEIANGYENAVDKTLEILPSLVVKKADDLRDIGLVQKYLKSTIMSKQYDNVDFITELVAKACVQIVPKNTYNFNVDNIRVCKILGSSVQSSKTMNGMVFLRGAEGEIKKMDKARIVVYTCPFDLTQTETKGTVLLESADELLKFSAGEETEVEAVIKALAENGVNVFDIRRLCRTTGAQAQARVTSCLQCVPPRTSYGECDRVYTDEIGDTEVTIFDKLSERGHVATIVVRGSSQSRMDDIERAIDDAINTYKALTRDCQLLPGAGAVEVELARQIESFGEKCAGLEQYSIKKFAHALESLPKQIAENAGLDPTEILSKIYAAHQEGQRNAGIDLLSGEIIDAVEANIYDLYSDAAITILKIDQIIMSKQASGGPAPRPPKPADEGDEE